MDLLSKLFAVTRRSSRRTTPRALSLTCEPLESRVMLASHVILPDWNSGTSEIVGSKELTIPVGDMGDHTEAEITFSVYLGQGADPGDKVTVTADGTTLLKWTLIPGGSTHETDLPSNDSGPTAGGWYSRLPHTSGTLNLTVKAEVDDGDKWSVNSARVVAKNAGVFVSPGLPLSEGGEPGSIHFHRDAHGDENKPVTVRFTVASVGPDRAVEGQDFGKLTRSVTFPSYAQDPDHAFDMDVPVQVLQDSHWEYPETFKVTLVDAPYYELHSPESSTATMTIYDDDGGPDEWWPPEEWPTSPPGGGGGTNAGGGTDGPGGGGGDDGNPNDTVTTTLGGGESTAGGGSAMGTTDDGDAEDISALIQVNDDGDEQNRNFESVLVSDDERTRPKDRQAIASLKATTRFATGRSALPATTRRVRES